MEKKIINDEEVVYLYKSILTNYTPVEIENNAIIYKIEADIDVRLTWHMSQKDLFDKSINLLTTEEKVLAAGKPCIWDGTWTLNFSSSCYNSKDYIPVFEIIIDKDINLKLPMLDFKENNEMISLITSVLNNYSCNKVGKLVNKVLNPTGCIGM